jgi:pyruvate, water dikinase
MSSNILWFEEITKKDTALVGGKNANLGEMISKTKVPVPEGFAITAAAYYHFIEKTGLDKVIKNELKGLNTQNMKDLESKGAILREAIVNAALPKDLEKEIIENYRLLKKKIGAEKLYVAIRSSATAEDLPGASFAGEQETYLNVEGEHSVLHYTKKCIASLFTNRAISYRADKGFAHTKVALSVAVEKMVRSDIGSAGVMFTIDPDSGYDKVIYINGAYGLGEYVVQGTVTPDEFYVLKPTKTIIEKKLGIKKVRLVRAHHGNKEEAVPEADQKKFVLTDAQVLTLAGYGLAIEKHYGMAMDIEWALDGETGKMYIVQARPETVYNMRKAATIEKFTLKQAGKKIISGQAVGRKIGAGSAKVILKPSEIGQFKQGEVLVTTMTDPDWEPIMKIASAIVTDKGGRTCHAAIVSRELGIPCVIGTLGGTGKISSGMKVTVDCTQEEGNVWDGILKFEKKELRLDKIPKTKTQVLVNVGVPEMAFDIGQLPVDGVGLAREEFIINDFIGEHPLAMIAQGRSEEYIDKLASGIAKIGAGFYPRPVIVRWSDFKTNEYANLKGGKEYEPSEANPMIGWRGCSRYVDPKFEPAFRLECRAMKKVRDDMKLTNVKVMLPFCRTLEEGKKVLAIMASEGLKRGKNGLEVYVMAEIPSNIIRAEEFCKEFDGFSIGSNDLTQLTLGSDRDNETLSKKYDERDKAVISLISQLIRVAKKNKRKVGICGQAPSDYPEYAEFLVREGIDSISLNPDVALETKLNIAKIEKRLKR